MVNTSPSGARRAGWSAEAAAAPAAAMGPQASARQLPATLGRIYRYPSPHTPASTPL